MSEYRRYKLPYGLWALNDGSIVVFNRKYQPIWRRGPNNREWEPQEPHWVKNIVNQIVFYLDEDAKNETALIKRLELIAARMHIPMAQ